MSRAALILVLPMLFACAKKEAPAVDTTAAAPADSAAPAAPKTFAGNWNVKVMPVGKDTVLTTYVLNATADQKGWKMTFPGRSAMDIQVLSMGADTVVTEVGRYESAISKGVIVSSVHSSLRLDGDKLVGTSIVHYDRKTADSVVTLRQEGTRQ